MPGDLKPFADILGINIDEVQKKFDEEMTEHKFQVSKKFLSNTENVSVKV